MFLLYEANSPRTEGVSILTTRLFLLLGWDTTNLDQPVFLVPSPESLAPTFNPDILTIICSNTPTGRIARVISPIRASLPTTYRSFGLLVSSSEQCNPPPAGDRPSDCSPRAYASLPPAPHLPIRDRSNSRRALRSASRYRFEMSRLDQRHLDPQSLHLVPQGLRPSLQRELAAA